MANVHVDKRIVISLDLKDFFPSIHQNLLQRIFENQGIAPMPARTISELCTYKYFVPQGALTSPKISNIVTATTFGPRLKEYCDSNGLTLSVYADDITVSSETEVDPSEVIKAITSIVEEYGFRINTQKTKVMSSAFRQYVCGVVVNKRTNLIKRERDKLRAIVHNVVNNGIEAEAKKTGVHPGHFISKLRGQLNWFKQLNPTKGEELVKKLAEYEASLNKEVTSVPTPTAIMVITNPADLPWS